jgi:glycosyltransferase involved in cell wall biosynthesis
MNKNKKIVLIISTREISNSAFSGREKTLNFINESISGRSCVKIIRLQSLLENKSILRLLQVCIISILASLKGRPLPLQVLLFYDAHAVQTVATSVLREKPAAVYLDGVRSGFLSTILRKRFPDLRIICDFDDLMSRRMKILMELRAKISMGYLSKFVPRWVQTYLLDGLLGRIVQGYERYALANTERDIVAACNSVVLVSPIDAQELSKFATGRIDVIPPVMPKPFVFRDLISVDRFVFVGSDSLLQNRLSIEFLVNLWHRVMPQTELHIFGRQQNKYIQVPGVLFKGFVNDLADAYLPGSVLLAPSFVSGGVKTKVLEAMAYGVVPLGTEITFEGIAAPCEALTYSDQNWEAVVRDPSSFVDLWNSEGRRAIEAATQSHSSAYLSERWSRVVLGP